MDSVNYVAKLLEFAQKTRQISEIKFEEVGTDGPDHLKTFTLRVVKNGRAYPIGTGRTKKEAKQNAAKHALNDIMKTEQNENTFSSSECPYLTSPHGPAPISQVNFVCWLNEHSQKNRLSLKAFEESRIGPNSTSQCCRYLLGDKEYPEAFGKTKREAKEEAAKLVFQELYGASQDTGTVDKNCDAATGAQKEDLNQTVAALCNSDENMNMSHVPKQRSFISAEETNFIGILNHYCQKTRLFHDFQLVERRGPSHNPQFVYKVVIDKREYPAGVGKTAKDAKQQAAQEAWSALQEQSDWNSQVSCRSTVSEEDGLVTSLTSSTSWESQNATSSTGQSMTGTENTSDSIIFAESSHAILAKDESPGNVKPKIKLAANFLGSSVKTKKEDPVLKDKNLGMSSGSMSNQPVLSRFLSEFDSIEGIGKGGFGKVYKAKRKLEQKYFAVKIVRSKLKAKREVGALADLQHPNIVRYYTAWEEDTEYTCDHTSESYSSSYSGSSSSSKFLYIQMELCDRRTLKVWIDERNAQRTPKRREGSLHITQQIVNGVDYIHSKKLIHRDLKPVNIMFGMGGGETNGEVKIGDFGLVTAEDNDDDENLLERTKRTGTRSYMAPEQRNKTSYDRKVDIFALGLIYFELLWNLSGMERAEVWDDIRSQRFPQRFVTQFPIEHKMIESMLCVNPEDRPEASRLKMNLTEANNILTRDLHNQQDNRTI
ncbi:interferon-induced, double-stranded RNA-activated protein kinase isoform X2 [Esox lucius]|uniref:interferon-induced, double-stranded RNA-activated protein kinase isoform X2 n=1 Tax=Esox lucius TaxID=8010 RepID=UPI00147723E5|nr:interferon-induced, double-stranded RNA-activated protein kinase isoform X2 [Esox lucius]